MKKLGRKGLLILKAIHLIGASMWIGACFCSLILQIIGASSEIILIINHSILIPGARILLIGGIIYGLFTHYGFFRQVWLQMKWILMIITTVICISCNVTLYSTICILILSLLMLLLSVYRIQRLPHILPKQKQA